MMARERERERERKDGKEGTKMKEWGCILFTFAIVGLASFPAFQYSALKKLEYRSGDKVMDRQWLAIL